MKKNIVSTKVIKGKDIKKDFKESKAFENIRIIGEHGHGHWHISKGGYY